MYGLYIRLYDLRKYKIWIEGLSLWGIPSFHLNKGKSKKLWLSPILINKWRKAFWLVNRFGREANLG